eukprot:CAMPEP_0182531172 /NCGR_PEP_ID=MMETSP1323-20130603/8144_1 /TAXON_ID=236787 /ORGANISM="Florenciella parvula, Strain RCC1693" /LENGTH=176 /DNA_ID=CAMNT_0024740671 /DNA_START=30 /DNA_END=558 /DNA_ORIENTATION=-
MSHCLLRALRPLAPAAARSFRSAVVVRAVDEGEATSRVLSLLAGTSVVNPAACEPAMKLDAFGPVEMAEFAVAVGDEFAVDVPAAASDKFATAADIISFVTSNKASKWRVALRAGERLHGADRAERTGSWMGPPQQPRGHASSNRSNGGRRSLSGGLEQRFGRSAPGNRDGRGAVW